MGEVVVAVSDVDDGLNERLNDEIYAFNAAATGLDDGQLLRVAVRGSGGELLAGLCGWTWGGCALMGAGGGTRTPNLLFTRQERIVHGVLAGTVLAGQVGGVVQLVSSCGAE